MDFTQHIISCNLQLKVMPPLCHGGYLSPKKQSKAATTLALNPTTIGSKDCPHKI
jgi:hypothetical protein